MSLAISVTMNLLFLFYAKRFYSYLTQSNEEIKGNINSLKEGKNDEIKELVMTRDILLMKLTDNKEALQKAKIKS